ncbi:hypothetical protein O9993_10005 [Vibrio lentus]|nr:hypothetical protein [Vibrio lentus]
MRLMQPQRCATEIANSQPSSSFSGCNDSMPLPNSFRPLVRRFATAHGINHQWHEMSYRGDAPRTACLSGLRWLRLIEDVS